MSEGPSERGGTVLHCEDVWKIFRSGEGRELAVLRGVDLAVGRGEAVSIVGASGAGKSTLLHLLGGLDLPTRGRVVVTDWLLDRLDEFDLARLRNSEIGFVFQFHHLLREFTALENVMMPALIAGAEPEAARDRARALLVSVGLAERESHEPRKLSGGEQQRVAVARALVNEPSILLADEPTGNLDARNSEQLHEILFRLREERALAMVVVTHNRELAARGDRILLLRDGVLVEEGHSEEADPGWSADA